MRSSNPDIGTSLEISQRKHPQRPIMHYALLTDRSPLIGCERIRSEGSGGERHKLFNQTYQKTSTTRTIAYRGVIPQTFNERARTLRML